VTEDSEWRRDRWSQPAMLRLRSVADISNISEIDVGLAIDENIRNISIGCLRKLVDNDRHSGVEALERLR